MNKTLGSPTTLSAPQRTGWLSACRLLFALALLPVFAVAQFDPRAHGDLTEVIMLCATEPGSARFDARWVDWLQNNPEADTDGAIRSVISRAGSVQSMAVAGLAPEKPHSRPDDDLIADHMARIAQMVNRRTSVPGQSTTPEGARVIASGSSDR